MRIIAGSLGGRIFKSPNSHKTHPMSDKLRGAIFNMLGDIDGLTVLDAFAGSGALGFEAISRGADSALLIDNDRPAQAIIAENIQALQLQSSVKLVKAGVGAWLQTTDQLFDIVLLDPPYDRLQPNLLADLPGRLKPGGQLVLSWPGKQSPPEFAPDLQLIKQKQYGDASLYIYQRALIR